MIQVLSRQALALGRSSGLGCRMSVRKFIHGSLKPKFSRVMVGVDVVMAYLYTSERSLNSRRPANIRNKIHPRDQISTLLVLGIGVSSISGAM